MFELSKNQPLSSVKTLKTYVPVIKPETRGVLEAGKSIDAKEGPLTCDHSYLEIKTLSVLAVAFNRNVLLVIEVSFPALAFGRVFEGIAY